MKGFAMNKFNSKGVIIALIIAIVGAMAAAWYFLWYVPHTPAYTLKIIHQAVQDKDADEALRHVDIKSIVKNIVEREGNKYVDTSTPLGKARSGKSNAELFFKTGECSSGRRNRGRCNRETEDI